MTGQLLDNSQGPVVSITEHPKTTSYACNRFSANGIKDTIQINLQDDTVYRQIVFRDHTFNIQQPIESKDKPQFDRDC